MPVKVKKLGELFRIVEPSGRIAKTPRGRPRDGGGHRSRAEALRQMRAINASIRRR